LDYSKKEYNRLIENFNTLKGVIDSYKKETIENYFNTNREIIEEVQNIYSTLNDLREKKYLLKSYLNKLESTLSDEDKEFTDENDIIYGSLLRAYEIINDKTIHYEQILSNLENNKNSLIKYSLFKDLVESPISGKYKYFTCEFDFKNFKCIGSKNDSYRRRYKNFGYLNDLYFKLYEISSIRFIYF